MITAKVWRPPRAPHLKINMDATFNIATGKCFFGVICRDSFGNLVTSSSNALFASSALIAEALISLTCNSAPWAKLAPDLCAFSIGLPCIDPSLPKREDC